MHSSHTHTNTITKHYPTDGKSVVSMTVWRSLSHLFLDLTLVQWSWNEGNNVCVCVVTKCSTKKKLHWLSLSFYSFWFRFLQSMENIQQTKILKSLLFCIHVKMPLDWWWLRTIFTYPMGIIFRYHLFCIKFYLVILKTRDRLHGATFTQSKHIWKGPSSHQ